MPIDREDGRHWCAPDHENPDEKGVWICPGCKKSWTWLSEFEIVPTNGITTFLPPEKVID